MRGLQLKEDREYKAKLKKNLTSWKDPCVENSGTKNIYRKIK